MDCTAVIKNMATSSICTGCTGRFLLLQNLHFRRPWRSYVASAGQIFVPYKICIPHVPVSYAQERLAWIAQQQLRHIWQQAVYVQMLTRALYSLVRIALL